MAAWDSRNHRWIERPTNEADELDLRCVACGVLGYTCPECEGWGWICGDGDDGHDVAVECEVCKGVGGIAISSDSAQLPSQE